MEKDIKAKATRGAEREEKATSGAAKVTSGAAKVEAKHSQETVGNAARKATEHSNADPRKHQQTQ